MADEKTNTEVTRVTLEWLKGRQAVSELLPFSKQYDGLLFEGSFQFKRPEQITEHDISVRHGILTSYWDKDNRVYVEVPVTDNDALFARAQATLEHAVVKAPDWWKFENLDGFRDVIMDVFVDVYIPWVSSFRRPVEAIPKGGAETPGATTLGDAAVQRPAN